MLSGEDSAGIGDGGSHRVEPTPQIDRATPQGRLRDFIAGIPTHPTLAVADLITSARGMISEWPQGQAAFEQASAALRPLAGEDPELTAQLEDFRGAYIESIVRNFIDQREERLPPVEAYITTLMSNLLSIILRDPEAPINELKKQINSIHDKLKDTANLVRNKPESYSNSHINAWIKDLINSSHLRRRGELINPVGAGMAILRTVLDSITSPDSPIPDLPGIPEQFVGRTFSELGGGARIASVINGITGAEPRPGKKDHLSAGNAIAYISRWRKAQQQNL